MNLSRPALSIQFSASGPTLCVSGPALCVEPWCWVLSAVGTGAACVPGPGVRYVPDVRRLALCISGPGALCVGQRDALCVEPRHALCRAPALFLSDFCQAWELYVPIYIAAPCATSRRSSYRCARRRTSGPGALWVGPPVLSGSGALCRAWAPYVGSRRSTCRALVPGTLWIKYHRSLYRALIRHGSPDALRVRALFMAGLDVL